MVVIIHKFHLNSVVRSLPQPQRAPIPIPQPQRARAPAPQPQGSPPAPKGPGPPNASPPGPQRVPAPFFNTFLRRYYIFSEQVIFLMSILNSFYKLKYQSFSPTTLLYSLLNAPTPSNTFQRAFQNSFFS